MSILDMFRIKKSIRVLLASQDAASPDVAHAISRLKQIGRPAVPPLIQALGAMQNSEMLTKLLAMLLDSQSLPLFCHGLSHPNPRVVAGVVKVLSQGDRYDPNRLFDLFPDPKIAKADLVTILSAQKDALHPKALLDLLNTVDKDSRSAIFRLMEQAATAAMIPELIHHTKSEDWLVRLHAARTLCRFSTETVRDALMRLLTDPHKSIRLVALEGLAGLNMPVDVGPLCHLLRDPDLTVQSKAIEAITQINDPQAIHHLLDVLQDESEYARRAAVEVLNAVGNTNAIKDLLGALRDKDWWVRVRAADALGSIGGSRVVEAVLPLIKDEDEFIRRCAVEVLNTTKDERAFTYLVEALGDKDWWVQERAVDALANLSDKRAIPALLRLLDQDTEATPAVIRALASLGDQQAIRPLLAKLQSAQRAVKKEVLRALASLTDAEHAEIVQRAIAQAMQVSDGELRELAGSSLRTIIARLEDQTCIAASPSSDMRSTTFQSQSLLVGNTTQYLPEPRAGRSLNAGTTTLDTASEGPLAPTVIDAAELEPGVILADRYRVIRRVGKGGFGIVFLVEDMVVHEEIILKFLNPFLAANDDIIKRFIRELRYARKITHENVIRIYDFITLGRSFAISMEYFLSQALASEITPGLPFDQRRGLKIIRDVCCGISVAHHANIVHRDLKPQNILINDDGLVKIVDFGLAAAVSHADSRLTGSGVLMGTPTYMAPEQVRGGTIDLRTDIYSLGVIMYEMFTGRPPYLGQDPLSILYQHVEGKATLPRTLNEHIPPVLEDLILKAMAVDPTQRYQSVEALRESLDALSDWEIG